MLRIKAHADPWRNKHATKVSLKTNQETELNLNNKFPTKYKALTLQHEKFTNSQTNIQLRVYAQNRSLCAIHSQAYDEPYA